jgi:signal transduction histidine kinase
MATMIAHEFNNILTPMISYCQMAQQEPDNLELHRKAVDRSLNGSLRAAKITTSMLGFAREVDEQTEIQLTIAIEEVFNLLARSPDKDGIELTIDVPADLRIAMSGVKLQQILLNLVLNARQAMRGKRGKLTLRAARQGDQVTLDIIDTGPGIPDEIRDRLFQPFVTQRHACDDHEKGTGLGLAVCRDLLTQSGGSITVMRTGPDGTTFRLQLPAA